MSLSYEEWVVEKKQLFLAAPSRRKCFENSVQVTCGVAQIRQVKVPLATLSGTMTVSVSRRFFEIFEVCGITCTDDEIILAGKAGNVM